MTDAAELTPKDLSTMLADDIERVVEALALDVDSRSRRLIYAFSPWNNHHKPKLEIDIGNKPGKWNDWVEGRYGDALSLVACVLSGKCDPKDRRALGAACRWAKQHFGLDRQDYDREAWLKRRAEAEKRARARAIKAARELSEARKAAKALWLASDELRPHQVDPETGEISPGCAGWEYLLARGIDLAQLPRIPRSIRLSKDQPWRDGEGEVRHVGPCLMTAMMLPKGELGSLHRTWIDPARPGRKADLDPPRKMWPASEGARVPIWRGETNLSEGTAAKRGVIEDVVVCEGLEDALSIALMTPELRVHAVGSLPGLLSYQPGKNVRTVIVAADNDWGKPQAEALLKRACQRLVAEFGKSVRIARSPEGKDFNDLLRGS